MQNFNHSKNKFGYVYLLTAQGIAQKAVLARSFIARKMDEYDALKTEIELLRSEEAEEQAAQALGPNA